MALKKETLEVNGNTYLYIQLSPSEALPLQMKISKIIGPAIAHLMQHLTGDNRSDNEAGIAIAGAFSEIFSDCDPEELTKLIKTVVVRVRKNGKHVVFDEDFQDDLELLYRLFFWALKVNFGNFIKGVGAKVGLTKLENVFQKVS
jgi:Phage tail assembly chaperone protein, TAC